MNLETLKAAKELDAQISKANDKLVKLQRPGIIVRIYSDTTTWDTITTIGTEEDCEHPDADLARAFLQQLLERRNKQSSALHEQFNAL